MKLIVAGSTGTIGNSVLKEALSNPAVTSRRRPRPSSDSHSRGSRSPCRPSKLKSVICEDFLNYSDAVKEELVNADGCIWTVAITPTKSMNRQWEEVSKVCLAYTTTALETLSKMPRKEGAAPLRFVYCSGAGVVRDPFQRSWAPGDYVAMRGHTETRVLEIAASSGGAIQAAIARPGSVLAADEGQRQLQARLVGLFDPDFKPSSITTEELGVALVNQAVQGFEKETILNEDLMRIGQKTLDQRRA